MELKRQETPICGRARKCQARAGKILAGAREYCEGGRMKAVARSGAQMRANANGSGVCGDGNN